MQVPDVATNAGVKHVFLLCLSSLCSLCLLLLNAFVPSPKTRLKYAVHSTCGPIVINN